MGKLTEYIKTDMSKEDIDLLIKVLTNLKVKEAMRIWNVTPNYLKVTIKEIIEIKQHSEREWK